MPQPRHHIEHAKAKTAPFLAKLIVNIYAHSGHMLDPTETYFAAAALSVAFMEGQIDVLEELREESNA